MSSTSQEESNVKAQKLSGGERYSHKLDDKKVIDPTSLTNTLIAHRKANAAALPISKFMVNGPTLRPSKAKKGQNLNHARDKWEVHARGKWEVESRRLILARVEGKGDDYEAEVHELTFDWKIHGEIVRYLRYPWLRGLDKLGSTPTESSRDRLHAEIMAADQLLAPTAEESEIAARVKRELEAAAIKNWNISKLDIIGSRATSFASPTSDLDLNIVLRLDSKLFSNPSVKDPSVTILHQLYRSLKNEALCPDLRLNFLAIGAKVPVISALHVPSQLEVQIQCADTGYGSMEVQKGLAAELPTLRPLFRILKHMLKMRGLSGSTLRAVTSYPLVIMIATALRTGGLDTVQTDAGTQLLHVLEFWGNFDTYAHGITHVPSPRFGIPSSNIFKDEQSALECIELITQDPVGAVPTPFSSRRKIPHLHASRAAGADDYRLTLHDPANPYNDLGFGNKYIKHCQVTFLDIYTKLKKCMSDWDAGIQSNTLSDRPPAILAPMLEADYSLYNLSRKNLLIWHETPKDTTPVDQRFVDMEETSSSTKHRQSNKDAYIRRTRDPQHHSRTFKQLDLEKLEQTDDEDK